MEFQTKRLLLRPWRTEDAEILYEYASDPEIGPLCGWKPHESVAESRVVIETVLKKPMTWAVCVDGRPVGSVGLFPTDQAAIALPAPEPEVGYWIGRPFWGRGLIPEAVFCLQRYAFEQLGAPAMWCASFEGNRNSRRVQEKCGFRYHHTEERKPFHDTLRTEHYTRLTRADWEAQIKGNRTD